MAISGAITQQVGVVDDQTSGKCGQRQYSIASTKNSANQDLTSSELSIDPTSGIVSVYTANRETIGTHDVTVSVSLVDYTDITALQLPFEIFIVESVVPRITDHNYLTKSAPLKILFDDFVVFPKDLDAGPITLKAYIFTGEEWPESINLTCSCLEKISDLSWI
jgi:hypothetical protein